MWARRLALLVKTLLGLLLIAILLGSSTLPPADRVEQVRAFTRTVEFDYLGWTLNALVVKLAEFSLKSGRFLSADTRHDLVVEYLNVVGQIQQGEGQLAAIFADPAVPDPQAASARLRAQLEQLRLRREQLAPVAESILQDQVSQVASELGLTLGGQPLPPVLYHSTPLPWALIVSPRNEIRQEADISLVPDLSVDQHVALEGRVERALDVSSLVVGIGGVGVYPTMVAQTSSLEWLSEVVAHEWIHNFLTLRPLGMNYMKNPALRTMNETAASIAGKEIGRAVLERYYPELAPPPSPSLPEDSQPKSAEPLEEAQFDFRREMHTTRLAVDQLLAEGKVDEAEDYMEQRRVLFWEQGYRFLRKLNQAYFAFHGAYADEAGGAAGTDPVGAAVRALRQRSPSLAVFLKQISWMSSFEQLQKAVNEDPA
jgi:hypothetical protein